MRDFAAPFALGVLTLGFALGGSASAQSQAAPSLGRSADQNAAQNTARSSASPLAQPLAQPLVLATRISPDLAPHTDGALTDPVWAKAATISDFKQINPVVGGAPSERTELRILYTETTLYIGAVMYHDRPDDITAKVMTRDVDVQEDDYLQIFIDSFNTGRDSYFFMVSPTGARRDGLTENNRKFAAEWDAIWGAKTQRTAQGWSAEIAIPFRSISYDKNAKDWGFQIRRRIQSKNEDIAWSHIQQALDSFDISNIGKLGGIENVAQGRGLEVQGFVTAAATYDWALKETQTTLDPSANIYYRFTPALTGTLTLNTDFSDTPLDPRQVNTDRFSLFFPETREFFLQDQSAFAFGGRAFRAQNGLPFFSRRIGIVGGLPVDIEAGAKLSGSAGPINIGALTTRTGRRDDGQEEQTLSVARLSADIAEGSRVGMIVTDGDPTGRRESTVWGVDGQYASRTLIPGKNVAADVYYLKSESNLDSARGESYGGEIAYPNDRLFGFTRFKHIDEGYRPALGFANRTGIRSYENQLRFRQRYDGTNVRYDQGAFLGNFTTDLDGDLQSRFLGGYLSRFWQSGANAFLFGWTQTENLSAPFTLPGGPVVVAGDYDWQRASVIYDSGASKSWRVMSEVECCDWYDGQRLLADFSAEYRPSQYINLKANYRFNDISVTGGDTEIHVVSSDVALNITPDIQIINQLQYDNISEGLGYFGRFRWEIRPQTQLLVTYSQGAQTDFDEFRAVQSGLSIRLGNSYRF